MLHAVIVTGYSRGIGQAVMADLFRRRREGLLPACFIFVGRSEPTSADLAAGDVFLKWDLATPIAGAACEQLGSLVSPHADSGGRLGLLYMSGVLGPMGAQPGDAAPNITSQRPFDAAMNVNVTNFIYLAEVVERRLARGSQGGLVFHLTSGAAVTPYAALPAYCASKAAALMYARCLAAQYSASRLCVLSVAPGTVRTAMTETLASSDAVLFPGLQKFRDLEAQGALTEAGPVGATLAALLFNDESAPWREQAHGGYYDLRQPGVITTFRNGGS